MIACTLGPAELGERVEEWRAVLARRSARTAVDGGVRLSFPPDPAVVVELARLVAAGCDSLTDCTRAECPVPARPGS